MLIHFARPALITRPLPRLLVTVRRLRLGWALMLLSVLAALAGAEPSDPLRYRGGLRNSADRYQLSAKQLSAVAASLREKTGFLDLRFDQDGFLTLGDRAHVGAGSAVARALLLAAVNSVDSFELESHNHSSDVVFAFLGESVIYESRVIGARSNRRTRSASAGSSKKCSRMGFTWRRRSSRPALFRRRTRPR